MQALASRADFSIGAYLGVPVMRGPSQLFGTLCVLDPEPLRFDADHLDLLVILSAWLDLLLERERTVGRMWG